MSHLENCSKRRASGLVRVDSISCMNVGRVILLKSVDKLETSVKQIPLKTPPVDSTDVSERSTDRKASRVCIRRVWKVERFPRALLLLRTQLKGVWGATNMNMKENCDSAHYTILAIWNWSKSLTFHLLLELWGVRREVHTLNDDQQDICHCI